MGRHNRTVIVALVLVIAIVRPVAAEVTGEQVKQAIAGGVEYLKKHQNKIDGSWGEIPLQAGGMSALVTLALLSCGEDPKSPHMAKALFYMESLGPPSAVYTTSLQTMVFAAADPKKYQLQITRNARWLEGAQVIVGEKKGAWAYGDRGNGDNSNTQFALLALHEAERVGVKISDRTWRLALNYWLSTQKPDGSWGYYEGAPSTGSMTCAGISSVAIAAGRLHEGDASVAGDSVACCGQNNLETDALDRGLRWLGQKFVVGGNPAGINTETWRLYYLYGVERVGRLTGQRFLGRHDWYREGAETFVAEQDRFQKYWKGNGIMEDNPILATSFCLLFLSKGRRPVVISKLKYGDDKTWDLHRDGVQNLTRRVEQRWKRDLIWQTIDVKPATVEDLLQTPVLFISGRDSLPLTREQKENLKQYIDQGGFIFAEACEGDGCDGKAFDREFRALMQELFPNSQLRLLPPDHPVWYAEEKVDPKYMRPLYGVDACCRTSVVYCPRNLSCFWSLLRHDRPDEYPDEVRKEIEAVMRIGENVVTYATNRELKDKLDRPQLALSTGNKELTRGTLFVPKISHGGGSDDAPNALANLLTAMQRQTQVSVNVEARQIAPTDEQLFNNPLVFMHGRRNFRFSPAERKSLATFLERGGFLFADSICASSQFTESFRGEMQAIFPDAKLVRIPVSHAMFTQEFRGFDLSQVTLRDPQSRSSDDPLTAKLTPATPFLEGIEIEGRWAVIFSPYDLSCALENSASLECKGYIKQDAAKIGINVILYALQQ